MLIYSQQAHNLDHDNHSENDNHFLKFIFAYTHFALFCCGRDAGGETGFCFIKGDVFC